MFFEKKFGNCDTNRKIIESMIHSHRLFVILFAFLSLTNNVLVRGHPKALSCETDETTKMQIVRFFYVRLPTETQTHTCDRARQL